MDAFDVDDVTPYVHRLFQSIKRLRYPTDKSWYSRYTAAVRWMLHSDCQVAFIVIVKFTVINVALPLQNVTYV